MKRGLALTALVLVATSTLVPAQGSHLSEFCYDARTGGPQVGEGASCALLVECDRGTPGTCSWTLRVRVGSTVVLRGQIRDQAGHVHASCFGTPSCEADTDEYFTLNQGEAMSFTCESLVVSTYSDIYCQADQRLP